MQISSIFDISTQNVSILSLTHAQKQKLPRREKKGEEKGKKEKEKGGKKGKNWFLQFLGSIYSFILMRPKLIMLISRVYMVRKCLWEGEEFDF